MMALLAAAVILLLTLTGCAGKAFTPAGPPPPATEILAQAMSAAKEVTSYRISFEIETGPSPGRSRAEAAWTIPGNFSMRQETIDAGKTTNNEVISVNGTTVVRMTGSHIPREFEGWREEQLKVDSGGLFSLEAMLQGFPLHEGVATVEHGTLEDASVYVLSVDQEIPLPDPFLDHAPSDFEPPMSTMTIFVDVETYLTLRISYESRGSPYGPSGTPIYEEALQGWTMTTFNFHDFNTPITITLPDDWTPIQ